MKVIKTTLAVTLVVATLSLGVNVASATYEPSDYAKEVVTDANGAQCQRQHLYGDTCYSHYVITPAPVGYTPPPLPTTTTVAPHPADTDGDGEVSNAEGEAYSAEAEKAEDEANEDVTGLTDAQSPAGVVKTFDIDDYADDQAKTDAVNEWTGNTSSYTFQPDSECYLHETDTTYVALAAVHDPTGILSGADLLAAAGVTVMWEYGHGRICVVAV